MIGYTKKLTGRMGNRLFQYHFMKQLSYKFEVQCFHPAIPDFIWFKDMDESKLKWSLIKKTTYFKSSDILKLGTDGFLEDVKGLLSENRYIVLEPPILGELFFDFLFVDPNYCIELKDSYKTTDLKLSNDVVNIAIHFRGTDFEQWNKEAILDIQYYIDSVEYCINFFDKEKKFYIFTDDLQLDTYLKLIEYMRSKGLNFLLGDMEKEAIYDFYTMSMCDVVISSPSTFSVWAGILNKNKKIIHSKSWFNNRISAGDKFWIDLNNSKNEIYKIWRSF